MRQYSLGLKFILLLWIFILLRQGMDLVITVAATSPACFFSMNFYIDVVIFALMVTLFVFVLKGDKRMILVIFGIILALESIEIAPNLGGISILIPGNGGETLEPLNLAYYIGTMFAYPVVFIAYTITYIVCLVNYLLNKRIRHTLVPIVSYLGAAFVLVELVCVALSYMTGGIEFTFFEIFSDFIKIIFFGIILFTLPQDMHDHNLY